MFFNKSVLLIIRHFIRLLCFKLLRKSAPAIERTSPVPFRKNLSAGRYRACYQKVQVFCPRSVVDDAGAQAEHLVDHR